MFDLFIKKIKISSLLTLVYMLKHFYVIVIKEKYKINFYRT